MKALKLTLLASSVLVSFGTATVLYLADPSGPIFAESSAQPYSCASIHFGMKDSDLTAMTYDCSTKIADLSGLYSADGVEIIDSSAENAYQGGSYTASDPTYDGYAIRIGASKKIGSVRFTLDKEAIGATLYCLAYSSDPVTIVCNGVEIPTPKGMDSLTKANAMAVSYEAATMPFEATNEIEITAKQASKTVNGKSVSACRFYLSDIALRVIG